MTPKPSQTAKKQEQINKPEFPFESYNLLVKEAELGGIQLIESNFLVKPEFFDKKNQSNLSSDGDFNYYCTISNISINKSSGMFSAEFGWHVDIKSGRKILLKTYANYLCYYFAGESINDEVCRIYMERVGKIATYPYFRSLTSQYGWAANANLPILPVLRTMPTRKRPSKTGTPQGAIPGR